VGPRAVLDTEARGKFLSPLPGVLLVVLLIIMSGFGRSGLDRNLGIVSCSIRYYLRLYLRV
jgi:hypothetical protein